MQTVSQRLALLRQRMALRGLDACVVVTDDFHGSEYVGDHFKTRAYLSGFTGSAGTLLVLAEAILHRPVPTKWQMAINAAGMAMLFALMIFATWQDILRIF